MVDDGAELTGLRVLVVEDMFLVAELIQGELEDRGCHVVGPVGHLAQGLALAESEALHGAFLDLNLAGESSLPIAKALEARGVPYIFITGYDDLTALPAEYRASPRLAKPFDPRELGAMVAKHFRKG